MAELKAATASLDARTTKIRNVPIAVTPEGFWCCPSQAVLQKTAKNQNQQAKTKGGASPPASKASSIQRAPTISSERRTHSTPTRSKINSVAHRMLAALPLPVSAVSSVRSDVSTTIVVSCRLQLSTRCSFPRSARDV